ncbi:response regulator transcription factor [Shewanella intestini]|uniref:Response regulator transcription factor n=1 Tax=Shewanella intestini TaxID=2017544 RepID=A0ABS5I0G8_9GAMM|nr:MULTISPECIES: response regulator [Shewanella]MBR9727516.1 response regulator transcription factor [Shewanella intestini]MRG35334.1 response regulator [Shewanella sp. XMDDZSB0408]
MQQPLSLPVYLVDDDAAIVDAISFLMQGFGYTLNCFQQGQLFLSTIDLTQPGCVILDARMPDLSGPEIHQRLNEANSPLSVIFLTGHGDVPMAVDAFKNGAFDFFQKPVQGKALSASIDKGLRTSQKQYLKQQHIDKIDTLSEREKQIFNLVIAGQTNKQMSQALFLSVRTIEVHRAKLMDKLDANNLAELIKLAPLATAKA